MIMESFGQYILLEKVASGGMAELFKAKKLGIEGFERILAIKRILPHLSSDEEFIKMFIAEAKLVAHLSHKNIAQIFDFGKIGQNYYIAMEYVRGKDLRTILKKCKEKKTIIPIALTVSIAKEVASALEYAHELQGSTGENLKIIHRDISPQNIIVSYEGEVKVVDFGIAKAGAHSKTSTGLLKGKVSYMSPEQAWGKPIDHRSDIFSLGIVTYEMLTGERLFKGDTELNTLERVRAARVETLPSSINADIPPELEANVLKSLSKDLVDRYQHASDMGTELGNTLLKLFSTYPTISLKQFMHTLFKDEIEAEQKSEMLGETVSIQLKTKPTPTHFEKKRKEKEEKPLPKRKRYHYGVSFIVALAIIIMIVVLWPHADKPDKEGIVPVPLQAVTKKVEQEKVELLSDKPQKATQKTIPEEVAGKITINATPWANIYINGRPHGTTPKTVGDLKVGKYTIRLENPNFPVWEKRVYIAKGETTKVSYKFGGFGKLIINATPWGNVYVDGTLIGQTPLTINKLTAQEHQIKVSRDGYREFSKTLTIEEGATERISVNLIKEGGE